MAWLFLALSTHVLIFQVPQLFGTFNNVTMEISMTFFVRFMFADEFHQMTGIAIVNNTQNYCFNSTSAG